MDPFAYIPYNFSPSLCDVSHVGGLFTSIPDVIVCCMTLTLGSLWLQVVLGALLFFVVPKNKVPGFKRSLTPDTFSQAAVEMDTIPAGVGSEVFCIVFDAGSTGKPLRHTTARSPF